MHLESSPSGASWNEILVAFILKVLHTLPPLVGENGQLVTDEPVEFDK